MENLLAQKIENPVGPSGFAGGEDFFAALVPGLIRLGFVAGVLVFFFILLAGAIQWMTSGGDKAAIETARGKITNAIMGIVILFGILAILVFIGRFFGLDILENLKFNIEELKIRPQ